MKTRSVLPGLLTYVCAFLAIGACSEERLQELLLPGGAGRPSVIASLPARGATGTGPLTEVWVLFSEPMDPQKTQSALRVSSKQGQVSGSFRWEGTKLLFLPGSAIAGAGEHSLLVGREAESLFGADLGQDFVVRFHTGSDGRPPVFVASDPQDAGALAADGSVTLRFSKPIRFDSLNDGLSVVPPFGYTLVPSPDRTEVVVRPDALLSPGNYVFTISESVLDDEGAGLGQPVTLRLTVGTDFQQPSLTGVRLGSLPLVDGQLVLGGERSDNLILTFSEPMQPSAADAITIAPPVPFLPVWNAAGTELTLQFVPALASDTRYKVTVSTLARDVAGNGLAAGGTFDVRTDGPNSLRPEVTLVGQSSVTLPGAVDGSLSTGAILGPLLDFSPIDLAAQVDRVSGPGFAGAIELRIQFSRDITETSLAANVSFDVILDSSPNLPNVSVHSVAVAGGSVGVILISGSPFPSGGGTPIYRLRINGGAGGLRDTMGNELADDFILFVTF